MEKARKTLVGFVAVIVLSVAFSGPAGAAASGADAGTGPIASEAKKKKCKKKKKKCKKKQGGGAYLQGRWFGAWAEGPAELRFNVFKGRLYTGPFDSFFGHAICHNSSGVGSPTYTDSTFIKPVEAAIANGSFSGAGTYPTGSGRFIPWKLSGQIQGGRITNGVFEIGPYPDFAGDPCSGTTHFTAEWFSPHLL
jgi:hypothetical protein